MVEASVFAEPYETRGPSPTLRELGMRQLGALATLSEALGRSIEDNLTYSALQRHARPRRRG